MENKPVQNCIVENKPVQNRLLSWSDLDEYYIHRFRLEEAGRSYAINYEADAITDVYRKIYYSYPYEQRKGYEPIDETIKLIITYSDLQAGIDESLRRFEESAILPPAIKSASKSSSPMGYLDLSIHPSNMPK